MFQLSFFLQKRYTLTHIDVRKMPKPFAKEWLLQFDKEIKLSKQAPQQSEFLSRIPLVTDRRLRAGRNSGDFRLLTVNNDPMETDEGDVMPSFPDETFETRLYLVPDEVICHLIATSNQNQCEEQLLKGSMNFIFLGSQWYGSENYSYDPNIVQFTQMHRSGEGMWLTPALKLGYMAEKSMVYKRLNEALFDDEEPISPLQRQMFNFIREHLNIAFTFFPELLRKSAEEGSSIDLIVTSTDFPLELELPGNLTEEATEKIVHWLFSHLFPSGTFEWEIESDSFWSEAAVTRIDLILHPFQK